MRAAIASGRSVLPGIIRTVAGTGVRGFSGDGGIATQAQLDSPYGILLDPRGNLFVADLGNSRVRRIAPDGTITTVAGGGSLPAGGANDGSSATVLALQFPAQPGHGQCGQSLYIRLQRAKGVPPGSERVADDGRLALV